jgi:uncharacterized protein
VNPFAILGRHCDPSSEAFRVLAIHSVLVARKARDIAQDYLERHPRAELDLEFLTEAALLHDLGIVRCHAPEIGCTGSEPYIRHGVIGQALLEAEGYPRHALVCARHTGAGISRADVRAQGLPLPEDDYLPVSLAEKVICVADKFYGKKPGQLWRKKKRKDIERSLAKHGPHGLERWEELSREILGS